MDRGIELIARLTDEPNIKVNTDEQGNILSIKLGDTLIPVETRVDKILETVKEHRED